MRQKRRVFMDACITAVLINIAWQILEMIFYGKVQLRIVDDVIWLILFRYIYLAKKRKDELHRIKEKTLRIPCWPRMGEKRDVPWL